MKYSLTLSRWHKVVERINAAVKERETSVKTAFTATTISTWNKQGIEEKAAEMLSRAARDICLIEVSVETIARIRTALAIRNAKLGISRKLAEAEAANRRASLYRAIIEGQRPDMVRAEHVSSLPPLAGDSEPFGFGRRVGGAITLELVDLPLLEEYRENLTDAMVRATTLLDEVAELNREKIELDLPEEIHQIAGLAAGAA